MTRRGGWTHGPWSWGPLVFPAQDGVPRAESWLCAGLNRWQGGGRSWLRVVGGAEQRGGLSYGGRAGRPHTGCVPTCPPREPALSHPSVPRGWGARQWTGQRQLGGLPG